MGLLVQDDHAETTRHFDPVCILLFDSVDIMCFNRNMLVYDTN